MVYSLRNLLISFTIVIIVVLLIVFHTLSTLRAQEQEEDRILSAREVMQQLGPAVIHMQQTGDLVLGNPDQRDSIIRKYFSTAVQQLVSDSAAISRLALSDVTNAGSYHVLNNLQHRLINLALVFAGGTSPPEGISTVHDFSLQHIDSFKNVAGSIEEEKRQILNTSYARSVNLARETFSFVRLLSGLLVLILLVSFYFVYHDLKTTRRSRLQLEEFNTLLEKKVHDKIEQIRDSEKRYRSLFESMMDACHKVDMQGRFIEFNPAFRAMIGYSDLEIYSLTHWDITPEKWKPADERMFQEQLPERGYSDVYEKEYIRKDGSIFAVELRHYLLREEAGQPAAIWSIVRDIDDRKTAERKLAASEQNLRYVLSSTQDNFYVLDKKYQVTLINEAAKKNLETAWGKTVEIGTNILEVIPNDTGEPIIQSLEKVMRGEEVEYELSHVQESLPAWVLVTYTPVSDDEDRVIGAFIHARDITERKKAELELVEAESKFRNLVEQSLVGVYILVNNRFAYVNPRLADILGYTQTELEQMDQVELVIQPADRPVLSDNIRQSLSGTPLSDHYEIRGLKKDGRLVDLEVFGTPTKYKGDPAIIGTVLDITERKKAENEKEQVRHLLGERVKELTTLYQVSRVLQKEKLPVEKIIPEILQVLPSGWQYAGDAAARIVSGDKEYSTPGFREGAHRQTAAFNAPGGQSGMIEVVYLEPKPPAYEDAFMAEERSMINMVAEMLGNFLSRRYEADMNIRMQQELLNRTIQEQKTVTRAVLTAEEKERNKIGQELHDNVNQILASVKLYLSLALEKDKTAREEIMNTSIKLVDDAIGEIRALSRKEVTPLRKINLEELILSVKEKLDASTSIKTTFVYSVNGKIIGDDLKLNIYRIVQEQVNNILKHAGASSVNIQVTGDDAFLFVDIADNGKGFDLSAKREGIGLANMVNRVESFNGQLRIHSRPGEGCRVEISIPC